LPSSDREAVPEVGPVGATAGPRLSLDDLPEDDQDYSGNVVLDLGDYNSWDTGFCVNAEVTNEGDETATWEVSATISGDITSIWNAETWLEGEESVFVGVEWNATLAPGETTTFGFCGSY
jgi:cellulase/cellobiase CelA1